MKNNSLDIIEDLNKREVIWYIFIFLIVINININRIQKNKINNENSFCIAQKIHNGNMLVLIVSLILYIYFYKVNYIAFIESKNNGNVNQVYLNFLTLFANFLFIISGIILVFVETKGKDPFVPVI